MKRCSRCEKAKPTTDFHKAKGVKGGFTSWCKACVGEYHREYHRKTYVPRPREVLTINELSDVEAAYIAGFLDGEGTISLNKGHTYDERRRTTYHLRVRVVNTFPGIIEWIAQKVGHGNVHTRKRYLATHKQAWEWSLSGSRAVRLLEQLYPYLKVKKLQAEVAFEYLGTLQHDKRGEGLSDKVIDIRDNLKTTLTLLNTG